jgi:uncharacterized membrane protein
VTTLAPPGSVRPAGAPVGAEVAAPPSRPASAVVWAGMAAFAAVVAWLSVRRHQAFYTGRLDLGNMIQAAWTTAHGDLLATTDVSGRQISRLAAHVDPLLVLFAPIVRVWPRPEVLLVGQAAIVALGALPIFWLGRRWLRDERLAAAGAALYLLYPPLQWAALTEFHPVTLAAPLLAFAIWAAEEGRLGWLAAFAAAAALSKEQVGLAFVPLGIWMAVRGRPRAGLALAGLSAAYTAIAVAVVIPAAGGGTSPLAGRYAALGDGPGEIAVAILARPWEVAEALADHWSYLLALLLPLLLLPLAAPLLAAGAAPDVVLNVLSAHGPQGTIYYHYAAVPAPVLVAAAVLGLARLRECGRPAVLRAVLRSPRALAAVLVAAGLVAGVRLGPLPWWSGLPGGSHRRAGEYEVTAHARALARAVAVIPGGVPVSASNHLGAHLSARERVYLFPVLGDAEWVAIDVGRTPPGIEVTPFEHAVGAVALLTRPDFRIVHAEDGALVLRRRGRA